MKLRRVCATLIAAILMIIPCLEIYSGYHLKVYAKNGTSFGRVINVVYDDSGSMVKDNDGNYIPRWSQAKYSLEVFAAMLGEEDTMNVYPMSYQGKKAYSFTGKDGNRVKTVHDMNSRFANTPFEAVKSAGNDLEKDSSGAEKWLIIITDGAFDDGATPISTIQSTIDDYNDQGIKVAYLAIGDDATVLDSNPSKGFYTEKAGDGIDVLNKVTSIANQIFEHLVLPTSYIKTSGNNTTLSFDIPTEQIVVFAQGDNVKIGDMQSAGKTIRPTEVENVKYSDVVPENYTEAITDTTLKGVVATFSAGDVPYAEGDFQISVSGAETIEYYYKPGVIVNADLIYDDKPVNQDAELYSGDYTVSMNFVNPITGKKIESKLLSEAKFSLTVTNNGEKQVVDSDNGKMKLVEGDVELVALAELPGQVALSDKKNYVVLPEPISLQIKFDKDSYAYSANEIADNSVGCIITVTNEETGALLSENEWNSTDISVESKGGIEWKVEKGDEVSTWRLIPVSSDGSIASVQASDYEFTVAADYQIDRQYAHGADTLKMNVEVYKGSPLILETEAVPDYKVENLNESAGFIVKAYIENNSGEKVIISEELWNNMSFEASSKNKIDVEVKKGNDVGSFIIYPRCYKGKKLCTDHGNVQIIYSGDVTDGEHRYSGEGKTNISIEKLSTGDWIHEMIPYFIAMGVILFILIGYIKKNKIRTKKMYPHNFIYEEPDESSGKRKIEKKMLSVIIPYVDEKALVHSRNGGYECNFPNLQIKAVARNAFKITNRSIDLDSVLINGEKYENMKELHKATFFYASFEIVSIDKKNNDNKLGCFAFYR